MLYLRLFSKVHILPLIISQTNFVYINFIWIIVHPFLKLIPDITIYTCNKHLFHWSDVSFSCSESSFSSLGPPSDTPSLLATLINVPIKHLISMMIPFFSTYSPSSFAFTSIGSSSQHLICAQPVRPGGTSFAPYLSRSSIKSY